MPKLQVAGPSGSVGANERLWASFEGLTTPHAFLLFPQSLLDARLRRLTDSIFCLSPLRSLALRDRACRSATGIPVRARLQHRAAKHRPTRGRPPEQPLAGFQCRGPFPPGRYQSFRSSRRSCNTTSPSYTNIRTALPDGRHLLDSQQPTISATGALTEQLAATTLDSRQVNIQPVGHPERVLSLSCGNSKPFPCA